MSKQGAAKFLSPKRIESIDIVIEPEANMDPDDFSPKPQNEPIEQPRIESPDKDEIAELVGNLPGTFVNSPTSKSVSGSLNSPTRKSISSISSPTKRRNTLEIPPSPSMQQQDMLAELIGNLPGTSVSKGQ
jgi:hypothetical protein